MSINAKLERLIELLTKATEDKELNWEATTDENSFRAMFPGGAVRVNRSPLLFEGRPGIHANGGGGIPYSLTVLNGSGEVVDEYSPDDSTRLANLFSLARKSALRPDDIVDSIMAWLESPPKLRVCSSTPK